MFEADSVWEYSTADRLNISDLTPSLLADWLDSRELLEASSLPNDASARDNPQTYKI